MYSVAVARSRPALLVLVASIALLLGGASLSSRTSDWSARSVPWICPSSSSSSSAFTSASDPDPTLAPGWVDAEGDFHSPGFHSFYKRIIELRGQDGATEILGLKEELPWMMNTTIVRPAPFLPCLASRLEPSALRRSSFRRRNDVGSLD